MNAPRDPVPLGRTVAVWQYLYLAASVTVAGASALLLTQAMAIDPATPVSATEPTPGLGLGETAVGLTNLLLLIAMLVAGFLTLKWIYRVNGNAKILAAAKTVSAGWAIGWFFVPIANLMMPFRAMRESWQISQDPQNWTTVPVPPLLRVWWALWLIGTTLDSLSFRLTLQSSTVGESLASTTIDVISSLLNIPLTLALITIVRRLSASQQGALQRQTFD